MADVLSDADVGLGGSAPGKGNKVLSDAAVGIGAPAHGGGVLSNNADDGAVSRAAKGAGTAAIQGAGDVPGILGNMADLGMYLGARGVSALTGRPMEDLQAESEKGKAAAKQWYADHLPSWMSAPFLKNGDEYAAPVLAKTGEYQPEDIAGRMGMAAVRGTVGALGGGPAKTGESILANALKQAPVVAGASALGQGVGEATGDPLLGMAAGAALPAAGGKIYEKGKAVADRYTAPMRESRRQGLADEQLASLSSDPEKALADLSFQPREIVPGSRPTTGEVAGDAGLLHATEQAGVHDPDFKAQVVAQQGEQNVARRGAVNDMQPTGDPMRPSEVLSKHFDDVDAATQAAVERLSAGRDELNGQIPGAVPAEASGEQLRGALQKAHDLARAARARLYKAVDPEGKLAIVATPVRDAAEVTRNGVNPDVSLPSPHATPVLEMAANLPDVVPFGDLTALDATISTAMSQAKRAGDYTGHAQLVSLKGAVKDAIAKAVDNQHAYEQSRPATGNVETQPSSMFDRWKAEADAFQAARARDGAPRGSGGNAVREPGGVLVPYDEQGVAGGRPGNGGGVDGLPPAGGAGAAPEALTPNVDPSAAGRIADANAAHADFAQTYRDGPVGTVLKDNGFSGQYTTPDSAVPAKAFVKGDKGYETAQTMLDAAKGAPEAVGALQDMAVTRLREAMKDGPLTDQALARWKQQHAGALRALDEVSPGFSSQFDNAASATRIVEEAGAARAQALKEAQAGAAGKIMGATHPDEVRAQVGALLGAKDGPTQIAALMDRVSHDPEAVAGLRRAGVEHIMDKVSNAGTAGGEPVVSGAKLGKLINEHEGALEALYGKDGLANMRRVAADLERAQQAHDALKVQGSNTANKMMEGLKQISKAGHASVGAAFLLAGMEAFDRGGVWAAMGVGATAAAKHLISTMRANGLNSVNELVKAGLADPAIGRAMLERAINKRGQVRPSGVNALATAIGRGAAIGNSLQQDSEAPPLTIHRYAKGGVVERDEMMDAPSADPRFMENLIDAIAARIRATNPREGGALRFADGGVVRGYADGGVVYDPMGNVAVPGADRDYRDVPGYKAVTGAEDALYDAGKNYVGHVMANGKSGLDMIDESGRSAKMDGGRLAINSLWQYPLGVLGAASAPLSGAAESLGDLAADQRRDESAKHPAYLEELERGGPPDRPGFDQSDHGQERRRRQGRGQRARRVGQQFDARAVRRRPVEGHTVRPEGEQLLPQPRGRRLPRHQ